jgi:hypothetical protein
VLPRLGEEGRVLLRRRPGVSGGQGALRLGQPEAQAGGKVAGAALLSSGSDSP